MPNLDLFQPKNHIWHININLIFFSSFCPFYCKSPILYIIYIFLANQNSITWWVGGVRSLIEHNHVISGTPLNLITYVSTKVFRNLQHNLFYSKCNEEYEYFCHLSSKRILYYLGYQVEVSGASYANMYSLQSNAYQIYQTLSNNSILSCILRCLNQKVKNK